MVQALVVQCRSLDGILREADQCGTCQGAQCGGAGHVLGGQSQPARPGPWPRPGPRSSESAPPPVERGGRTEQGVAVSAQQRGDVFVAETASRAACGGQRTWGPSPGTSRSTSLLTFRASGKPWVFVKVRASCLRESRVPTLARPSRQAPPYGCRACPGGPRHRA